MLLSQQDGLTKGTACRATSGGFASHLVQGLRFWQFWADYRETVMATINPKSNSSDLVLTVTQPPKLAPIVGAEAVGLFPN